MVFVFRSDYSSKRALELCPKRNRRRPKRVRQIIVQPVRDKTRPLAVGRYFNDHVSCLHELFERCRGFRDDGTDVVTYIIRRGGVVEDECCFLFVTMLLQVLVSRDAWYLRASPVVTSATITNRTRETRRHQAHATVGVDNPHNSSSRSLLGASISSIKAASECIQGGMARGVRTRKKTTKTLKNHRPRST